MSDILENELDIEEDDDTEIDNENTTPKEQEQPSAPSVKPKTEPKARSGGKSKKDTERVRILLPFIPGEDSVVDVVINGKFTRIKRGVPVEVLPEVAEVLEHSSAAELRYLELEAEINKE